MKVKAIRVHKLGGPEMLSWEEVEIGEPNEGEIRIKNKAIGVNYVDIYYRTGLHRTLLPSVPGNEAVGVVSAMGPGVTGINVGDVVGYADNPMGSYAEEQIIPASVAIPIPPSMDFNTTASVLLKGMTAYVLVQQAFKIQAGHTVLVHAAAGGVGAVLCQWANALGATVIGTISTEKVTQATQDGCRHVILYTKENFVARVVEIMSGKGVHAVYDAVGKDTFKGSLACLMPRGCMVSYGQSSGRPDPVSLGDLAPKSLVLVRPGLVHYTTTRNELLQAAGEVFANIAAGVLRVRVSHVYLLSEAARAHADLEARRTSGSIVLVPGS